MFDKYIGDRFDGTGKSQLMIAKTNKDVDALNLKVHKALQEKGIVGQDVPIKVAAKEGDGGALASTLAAELYGLAILDEDVQDMGGNTTRFLVIGKEFGKPTKKDKTSVLFTVKHKVGALYDALAAFKLYNLNMTKIESRPSKAKAWEYCFFVDFEGHVEDVNIQKALEELSENCTFITILGSYPKASDTES